MKAMRITVLAIVLVSGCSPAHFDNRPPYEPPPLNDPSNARVRGTLRSETISGWSWRASTSLSAVDQKPYVLQRTSIYEYEDYVAVMPGKREIEAVWSVAHNFGRVALKAMLEPGRSYRLEFERGSLEPLVWLIDEGTLAVVSGKVRGKRCVSLKLIGAWGCPPEHEAP